MKLTCKDPQPVILPVKLTLCDMETGVAVYADCGPSTNHLLTFTNNGIINLTAFAYNEDYRQHLVDAGFEFDTSNTQRCVLRVTP